MRRNADARGGRTSHALHALLIAAPHLESLEKAERLVHAASNRQVVHGLLTQDAFRVDDEEASAIVPEKRADHPPMAKPTHGWLHHKTQRRAGKNRGPSSKAVNQETARIPWQDPAS
jgi:hypothetical protein